MNIDELNKNCLKIKSIAGKRFYTGSSSSEQIQRFYSGSNILYRQAHSKEGAMHLPVEFSRAQRHKEKLKFQAETASALITEHGYTSVLELGCGMGFNTNLLAKTHACVTFTGIDLTQKNLDFAIKNSSQLNNVKWIQGSFEKLSTSSIQNEKYDLIFAVETLCYAKNIDLMLQELSAYLTKNGRILIFDGYKALKPPSLQLEEKQCYKTFLWGYSLPHFQELNEIIPPFFNGDLRLEAQVDYSDNILPNWSRFQQGTIRALKFYLLLKFLTRLRILPLALIQQMAAGLCGPYFIRSGYLRYFKLLYVKSSRISLDEH